MNSCTHDVRSVTCVRRLEELVALADDSPVQLELTAIAMAYVQVGVGVWVAEPAVSPLVERIHCSGRVDQNSPLKIRGSHDLGVFGRWPLLRCRLRSWKWKSKVAVSEMYSCV